MAIPRFMCFLGGDMINHHYLDIHIPINLLILFANHFVKPYRTNKTNMYMTINCSLYPIIMLLLSHILCLAALFKSKQHNIIYHYYPIVSIIPSLSHYDPHLVSLSLSHHYPKENSYHYPRENQTTIFYRIFLS